MQDKELKNIQMNMVKIETNLNNFGKKLDDHIADQKSDIKEIKDMIDNFIEEADGRYANKLVEKVVYGMIGTILTIFIIALIYLVIDGNP